MKHYRFKNSRHYTLKQKLISIALSLLLSYLLLWIYLGYTSKQQLIKTINNIAKDYISIYYTDITISGFPFAITISIQNPKITIDPSHHAETLSSFIEKNDSPFPKLGYKVVYSSIESPIVITKKFIQHSYEISLPKEIISKHYFESQDTINLIYKLSEDPKILISSSSKTKSAMFLPNIKAVNINIPSYTLRKLEGDNIITASNGIDFYINSDKENEYNIKYINKGTRYTHQISDIIEKFAQTKYLKHLSTISPMQYEDMLYAGKYVDSGEGKINVEASLSLFSNSEEENSIELSLKRLEQSDEYGSISGAGYVKAQINKITNKLSIESNGYTSNTLKEIWHDRWIKTIDRAFQQINKTKNLDSFREKLKVLLPNLHHYKYSLLSYKLKYDGPISKLDPSYISLEDLRLQTNKFIIDVKRGGNFSENLDKLPTNFIIKINNSNTVLNIALDYLHDLIDTKVHNKSDFNHKILSNFRSFLNEVKHNDTVCKNNWNGQLKLIKKEWYLENYRLSTIQSIVLSIMSSATNEQLNSIDNK